MGRRRPEAARERSMRGDILRLATERFGRDGYEGTRWGDVARDLGVGPTALYHYFETKQHCLFVILESALADFHARFTDLSNRSGPFGDVLHAVLSDTFALEAHDVLRNQLLVAESGLLSTPRRSSREEAARQRARGRVDDIEVAWATFLARGMEQGAVAESDPILLARAVLGLYNSIWHWYRVDGAVALPDLCRFFVDRGIEMIIATSGAALRDSQDAAA